MAGEAAVLAVLVECVVDLDWREKKPSASRGVGRSGAGRREKGERDVRPMDFIWSPGSSFPAELIAVD